MVQLKELKLWKWFKNPHNSKNEQCVFFHIPKSAGVWVQHLFDHWNNKLGRKIFLAPPQHFFYSYDYKCGLNGRINYGGIKKYFKRHNLNNCFTICSIRDPFEWYLSFFIWSHGADPESFSRKGLVPHYSTFDKFILDNKINYVGAVRPHLNACNSFVRLTSLKMDFEHLVLNTFPELTDFVKDSFINLESINSLSNVKNAKQRDALNNSELKKKFKIYIDNHKTENFYTEEMIKLIYKRDQLIFYLLNLDSPIILPEQKLSQYINSLKLHINL